MRHVRRAQARALVDVVPVVPEEVDVRLFRQLAVGGPVPVLVVLAAAGDEAHAVELGARGGKGAGSADSRLRAQGGEAVPVGAGRLQAGQLDVHRVAELGPRGSVAAGHHLAEALVGGDLPADGLHLHPHAGVQGQGIGRQPRPDHEAVGRGVPGGHAQGEGRLRRQRLRAQHRRRGDRPRQAPEHGAAEEGGCGHAGELLGRGHSPRTLRPCDSLTGRVPISRRPPSPRRPGSRSHAGRGNAPRPAECAPCTRRR